MEAGKWTRVAGSKVQYQNDPAKLTLTMMRERATGETVMQLAVDNRGHASIFLPMADVAELFRTLRIIRENEELFPEEATP